MRTSKILVGLVALGLTSVGLNACFNVDQPICSFVCGPSSACPEDYECRSDGYCHLRGSIESCEFSDASTSTVVPDLRGSGPGDDEDGGPGNPDAFDSPDL